MVLSAQAKSLSKKAMREVQAQEEKLVGLSYVMHTDSSADQRFAACRELIKELVETLKTPNSYSYPFDSLRGVVVKESPDQKFRIFSWELHVDADLYRHYGAIQFNESKLKLIPLMDRGDELRENPENVVLTPDNWLGYVTYDIVPAGKYNGETMYFLFGFDRYGKFRRQKILDVLTFDQFGKPSFGAPVFRTYTPEGLLMEDRKRIILMYGAESAVVMRHDIYNNRIIYENLVMMPGNSGEGPVNVPDGSYHSLELDDQGIWFEVEKVFDHKYEEAPREAGKAPAGQDLFGRPKGTDN
ncbi:hypothetical protein A3850_012735 [Lewinella sp. 4G2]|nr:hypothetical protein A3850_012735 [Lewinella sp. 4G2]